MLMSTKNPANLLTKMFVRSIVQLVGLGKVLLKQFKKKKCCFASMYWKTKKHPVQRAHACSDEKEIPVQNNFPCMYLWENI